jgi:multidrug efflux system membrane fusion protein
MAIPNTSQQNDAELQTALHPLGGETSKPKKSGWLWILALIVLAGGAYYYYKSRPSSESKAAPAPGARAAALGPVSVAVTPALKQNVPYYLSGLGTVTAFNTVTVKSRVDGELQKVNFTEGQFVHDGDLLAEIDPRPFQVALEQMEGQLFRDQAQLNNARVDFKRYDQLAKEGVIASQQVDTQNAMVAQLEGAVRADQAQIDNEKLQLVYCKITAPLSGRVGLRLVDQGNMIHATDPNGLVVITQVQPIAVLFTLPEDSLQEVIQHMKSEELGVEAFSRDDQSKLATGKLLTVDNQIDPTTGTVRFKAAFENRDLSLWPNQFVNTRLMLAVRKDAIVVPLAAVQHGTQGSYVYTVKGGKANMQPVDVGLTQGNIALIATGVSVGDQVVVDGQERLQAGTSVEVHNALPSGPANGSGASAPAPAKDSDPSSSEPKKKKQGKQS